MSATPNGGGSADAYERVRAAYQAAEDAIHDLGLDGDGPAVPAINELRYAGNHVLQAVVADKKGDQETCTDQLQRALRHCQRSQYDAYDSAIYYQLCLLKRFQKDYAKVPISPVVPDYLQIVQQANQAREQLSKARSEAQDRAEFYEKAKELHAEFAKSVQLLEGAREELNKQVAAGRSQAISTWTLIGVTLVAGLAGAGVALLAAWLWP